MAITVTQVSTAANNSDTNVYTGTSFTPVTGRAYVAFVDESIGTGVAPRSVLSSSNGITWEELLSFVYSGSPGVRRAGVWIGRVTGTPSNGAVTFTMADDGSGTTATSLWHGIYEIDDVNTVWPVRCIRRGSLTITDTSMSLTMPTAADSDNRPIAHVYHRANETHNPRINWTELTDAGHTVPIGAGQVQWRSDAMDDASAAWTTATNFAALCLELNHSATTAEKTPWPVTAKTTISTGSSSVSCGMPAGYQNGELLWADIACDLAGTISQSDGWTEIANYVNSTNVRYVALAKISDGSDSLTLTVGSSRDVAVVVTRITNHGVTNPATDIVASSSSTGTSNTPDPPSVSAPSLKAWLAWAACASDDDDNVGAGAAWGPSGWQEWYQAESAQTSTSCMIQTGHNNATTSGSVDPGAFTLSASEEWVGATFLIPPVPDAVLLTTAYWGAKMRV